MVFNTRANCYSTAVTACWEQKSPVTEANPFSSVLRSWLEFNFTSVPAEKTCRVPCCRRYGRVCSHMSEQYHRQYREWSTARNFIALRGQRYFITLQFLCDLYVSSWKAWNQKRDDSTYCWKTTQRVVSTFHPTRLYCFVFAPSFFVFIRHMHQPVVYVHPPLDSTMRYS